MSKKGKHGVRNPKKSKPNPYAKRRNRGGWGRDPREDDQDWSRNGTRDDYDDDEAMFEDPSEFDDEDDFGDR